MTHALGLCQRLEVTVTALSWHRGHLHLDLAPGAPITHLVTELRASGFDIEASPGDHSIEHLSERERELLSHLGTGLQLKEVARLMGVETSTVREYWERAKRKLGVRTVGQAVSLWASGRN